MNRSRPTTARSPTDLRTATRPDLPGALRHLYRAGNVGERSAVMLPKGVERTCVEDILESAGFRWISWGEPLVVERVQTLSDTIRDDLRLLVCGLNPSVYSAETGVPFGRPGNRFWPAALGAGLLTVDRDVEAALRRGVGFTDIVKRATPSIADLRPEEYERGMTRVRRIIEGFRPRVVCFVGLQAWRQVVDRQARPGPLEARIGSSPCYLMPSTSGRNAHARLDDLIEHLQAAHSLGS